MQYLAAESDLPVFSQVFSGMFCAGFRKTKRQDKQKCATLGYGDSGGPLACKSKNTDTWTLAGVVSSSGSCQVRLTRRRGHAQGRETEDAQRMKRSLSLSFE